MLSLASAGDFPIVGKQAQRGVLRYFIAKDKLAFSDEIRMGSIPDAVGASWRT
jgi:hypothetical protein